MPRANSTPHLFQRRGSANYYARVRLPAGLGGTHLSESLRTSDRAEALRRLPIVVGRLMAEKQRRLRGADGTPKVERKQSPAEFAAWWREEVFRRGGDPDEGRVPSDLDATLDAEIEARRGDPIGEAVDEDDPTAPPVPLFDPEREAEAVALAGAARGERWPIQGALDRYITERRMKPRYAERVRRATGRLRSWRLPRPGGDDVKAVTRRDAADFVDHLASTGLSTATVNSLTSALRTYWDWMERRGFAVGNPWQGQQRTPEAPPPPVRAFTDAEAKRLLSGTTTLTLHDLMRIAALSGMRINEICSLKVADIADDCFHVRDAKTKAGIRTVPVHSLLKKVVARRIEKKGPEDYLLDELRAPASRLRERSSKASERFTAYRRDQGVDERVAGQRNSSVTFHSWRHRFVTQALQSGQPHHLVSAVVGHETGRETITLQVYDSGPSVEQLRAVVESVKLPEGAPVDSPKGPRMGDGRWSGQARHSPPRARKAAGL